ncbi:MAG: TetR/AcrR family transcriptional regulator [Actinobacteria bacterium]|nr:TetR/AcrR family transcriptional regulator [Actinomycetota bacterium]MBI3688534.1 TetR/AcrR family transcriptional regulator [Actinomycetota bacterium]
MAGTAPTAARRTRVTKRPEDRREELLAAALHTFGRVGVETSTVADITERAGVAKGTFYLYFESKDHVLGQLWDRYLAGFRVRAGDLLAGPDVDRDWPALLGALLDDLVRHALANADLHRVIYHSANAKALELCRQANETVIEMLVGAVRRAIRDGQLAADDPDLAVRMIYHGVDGLLDDVIGRDRSPDADRLVAAATEFAFRVLAPARSAAGHGAAGHGAAGHGAAGRGADGHVEQAG